MCEKTVVGKGARGDFNKKFSSCVISSGVKVTTGQTANLKVMLQLKETCKYETYSKRSIWMHSEQTGHADRFVPASGTSAFLLSFLVNVHN